jgi:hypothetical protein
MGFLSKIKEQYDAVNAQATAMADAAIPAFIAPRSQEEVDSLLAGTGTIRAIAFSKRHQVLQPGERVGRMKVDVRVRPRGPEGTLGEEVWIKASVSSWVADLIQPGLDIPVERDPATGKITQVASKQLTEELSSRKAEAEAIRPGWALDTDVQAAIDVPADIAKALIGKNAAPSLPAVSPPLASAAPSSALASAADPRPAPLGKVSWATAVAVAAYLEVYPASSVAEADAAGQIHGVIPGTWAAERAAWDERIAAEPQLAELWAWDVSQAAKALRS